MRLISKQLWFGYKGGAYQTINISSPNKFHFKDLTVTKAKTLKPLPALDPKTLGFGLNDTDHMMTVLWDKKTGWGKP